MLMTKLKIASMVLVVGFALVAGGTGVAYWAQDNEEQSGPAVQEVRPNSRQPHTPETHALAPPPREQSVLPGRESHFGGGPGEPRYYRDGNIFYVTAPHGEWFSVYNAATDKASTVKLPGTKESPVEVIPTHGLGLMTLTLRGPKIAKLYVYTPDDGKWYVQDLKKPVSQMGLAPIAGVSMVSYRQGRYIYTFSRKNKEWHTFELPKDLPDDADVDMTTGRVTIESDGHVHEFNPNTGEWTHYDFRAMIQKAMEAEEDAK